MEKGKEKERKREGKEEVTVENVEFKDNGEGKTKKGQ